MNKPHGDGREVMFVVRKHVKVCRGDSRTNDGHVTLEEDRDISGRLRPTRRLGDTGIPSSIHQISFHTFRN